MSGGLQSLDEIGDLVVDLLALTHESLDLLDGVDHGGVVAAPEQPSDGRVAEVGEFTEGVHGRLPGGDQWTLAALAAQRIDGEPEDPRHLRSEEHTSELQSH